MNKDILDKLDKELIEEREFRGKKYIVQLLPVRQAMELRQRWQDSNGMVIATKMHDLVLKNLIVHPSGLTVDSFRKPAEVEEITGWAINFQYGDDESDDIKN